MGREPNYLSFYGRIPPVSFFRIMILISGVVILASILIIPGDQLLLALLGGFLIGYGIKPLLFKES
jgi:hypothetical protein